MFNMVPTAGEVARFAFLIDGEPINIELAVRTAATMG